MAAESYNKNGLSTRKAFQEAQMYIAQFPYIPAGEGNVPSSLHSFRNPKGRFYGILDNRRDTLMLNQRFLKPIPSIGSRKQHVLNFVADAFSSLVRTLSGGSAAIKVKGTVFETIRAHKGWKNYKKAYSDHLSKVYEVFSTDFIQRNGRHKCINNIEQFMDKFFYDFMTYLKEVPITRSTFLLSQDPAISGLVIEISSDDHGHDLSKWRKWINTPAFSFYRFQAAKHGFLVDMNAPWRLIANLSSPKMLEFMAKYGIKNTGQLFSKFYLKAHEHDIEVLKLTMFEMYDDYYFVSPRYSKPVVSSTSSNIGAKETFNVKTETTIRNRSRITRDAYLGKYDDSYWLGLYARLRLIEGSAQEGEYAEQRLKGVLYRAEELHKYVDFSAAIDYINGYVKNENMIIP